MKSVLISIQPKWCELIASGKKTVEVRKTKPKLETPFKCYIYCTQARKPIKEDGRILLYEDDLAITNRWGQGKKIENPHGCLKEGEILLNGKVIGEFVCDYVGGILPVLSAVFAIIGDLQSTCLTTEQMAQYLKGKVGYAWHISDLLIYDKPKELSEFYVEGDCDCMNCKNCAWFERGNGYNVEDDCNLAYKGAAEHKSYKPITRPPQSWCYVEDRGGE